MQHGCLQFGKSINASDTRRRKSVSLAFFIRDISRGDSGRLMDNKFGGLCNTCGALCKHRAEVIGSVE